MPPAPDSDDERQRRLDEVCLAYELAIDAGQRPDKQALLARHPDLAPELEPFLADAERARSMRDPPEDPPLLTGTRVGDYELLEPIDQGGMGIVYKALRVSLQCHVALKMLRNRRLASPEELERFRREAQDVANLNHPHIVPILEFGEYQGRPFFSMWLMEGGNLTRLPPRVADNPRALARLLATVTRAVHYAHQRGILHCDLKPANVLLDKEGRPYVTDLGLARHAEGGGPEGPALLGCAFTCATTTAAGTPGYMAPEQAAGEKVLSTAVDVYGLGTILYELLTGRPPFPHGKVLASLQGLQQEAAHPEFTRRLNAIRQKILRQVQQEPPPPPRKIKPRVNRDLEVICLKCLEKEPGKRYGSAQELAEDLERFADGRPIAARRVGRTERVFKLAKRQPIVAALLTAVAVSSALGLGGFIWKDLAFREEHRKTQREFYRSNVTLAKFYVDTGQPDRAEDTLNLCPDHLRGWEWHYLLRLCSPRRIPFRGHIGPVLGLAYSPDGSRVATVGRDGTARVWDARTGAQLLTLSGHAAAVNRVCFVNGGRWLVTAGNDLAVKFWDAQTGREVKNRALPGAGLLVTASRSGNRLATLGPRQGLAVWDAATGKQVFRQPAEKGLICIALSPDGRYLAAGGFDKRRKLWDLDAPEGKQDKPLAEPEPEALKDIWSITFSTRGDRLAVGSVQVVLWEVASGKCLPALSGWGDRNCNSLSFSRKDDYLAGGDSQGLVRVWETKKGQSVLAPRPHTSRVAAVAFNPAGGRELAMTRGDQVTIENIDPTAVPQSRELGRHRYSATALAFRPGGGQLASRSRDGTAVLWGVGGGAPRQFSPRRADGHASLGFGPDGGVLLFPCGKNELEVWDAATGRNLKTLTMPVRQARRTAFSPDGRLVAIYEGENQRTGRIVLWDWQANTQVECQGGGASGVSSLAFSPDGKKLSAGVEEGAPTVWDVATGREDCRCEEGHTRVATNVAFSPDGKRLVTCSADWALRVWDARTGRGLLTLPGNTSYVSAVACSPDGKRLASCSQDGSVRIWDAETGEEMLSLQKQDSPVTGVAFSPDGWLLATCDLDGTVRVWDAHRLE